MRRTQIQLSEPDFERLRAIAASQRRSLSDCIREGVALFLRQSSTPETDLGSLAGVFRPLPMDDLKDHDRWLAEALAPPERKE